MKNKTKVVLGLAAMLAGTAGIAGVSTFAWFVTQNTTTITFNDAVVRGDTTDISVEFSTKQPTGNNIKDGENGITISNNDTKNDLKITGAKTNIIDLSGDGLNFYHPESYKKTSYEGGAYCTGITKYTNNNNYTVNYFVSFNVTVRNRGNVPTDVYLNQGSAVTAVGAAAASIQAAKATRVAIWQLASTEDASFTGATQRTLWSTDTTTDASYSYLSETQLTGAPKAFGYTMASGQVYENPISLTGTTNPMDKIFHYGVFTEQTKSEIASGSTDSQLGGDDADAATITTAPATKGGYLCHLNQLSSKMINVSMWIEGTDPQGTGDCIDGHVQLVLALKGVQRTKASV